MLQKEHQSIKQAIPQRGYVCKLSEPQKSEYLGEDLYFIFIGDGTAPNSMIVHWLIKVNENWQKKNSNNTYFDYETAFGVKATLWEEAYFFIDPARSYEIPINSNKFDVVISESVYDNILIKNRLTRRAYLRRKSNEDTVKFWEEFEPKMENALFTSKRAIFLGMTRREITAAVAAACILLAILIFTIPSNNTEDKPISADSQKTPSEKKEERIDSGSQKIPSEKKDIIDSGGPGDSGRKFTPLFISETEYLAAVKADLGEPQTASGDRDIIKLSRPYNITDGLEIPEQSRTSEKDWIKLYRLDNTGKFNLVEEPNSLEADKINRYIKVTPLRDGCYKLIVKGKNGEGERYRQYFYYKHE